MSGNGIIWTASGSSSTSSFFSSSPFFSRAQTTRLSQATSSSMTLWRDEWGKSSQTNGSTRMTAVLDSVGYALQLVANGTNQTVMGQDATDPTLLTSSEISSSLDGIIPFPSSTSASDISNDTTASIAGSNAQAPFPGKNFVIPLYTLIFFLSFIGNLMVILTLARNRRMRTVTNVLLLNLAISDLLLGVFCMPVTLIGQLLRNFIFGSIMCRLLPYFQAVFVSCGVWTLVAISLERYFAICRPLQSRKWQTRSHAYKMIVAVWLFTLTWNLPITFVSTLQPIRNSGRYKCREIWPNAETEKVFNLVLNFLLLLIPLCIMALAYSLIVNKLWKGLQSEIRHTRSFRQQGPHGHLIPREDSLELSVHSHYSTCKVTMEPTTGTQSRDGGVGNEILTLKGGKGVVVRWRRKNAIEVSDTGTTGGTTSSHRMNCGRIPNSEHHRHNHSHHHCNGNSHSSQSVPKQNGHSTRQKQSCSNFHGHNQTSPQQQVQQGAKVARAIRSTYTGKSIESKKKVIRMLFVLIAEFFVCWSPLYIINTWYLFDSEGVYNHIGSLGIVLIQLLAYASSCVNPITYCFLNRKFRNAFIKVFQCSNVRAVTKTGPQTLGRGSDMSANDSIIYGAPPSTLNKSVLVLECENRV